MDGVINFMDKDQVDRRVLSKKPIKGAVRNEYKGSKKRSFQIRASDDEMKMIAVMARRYTGGDVSKWLRFAAMNFQLTEAERLVYEPMLHKKVSG
jgi:hypothetical protein